MRHALLLFPLLLAACEQAGGPAKPRPAADAWFEEVAAESGLEFTHESGHDERFYLPEIMGGGAALFDMDDDGDLDAYLVQGGAIDAPAGNSLFRNEGRGRFVDATAGSGAEAVGYGMGVAAGDYDGDGDTDLYVTNVGPNVLLRNDGRGVFTDVTADAGVGHPGWGTAAAFVDYDRDGDLDLFLVNYLNWSPATELDCYNDVTGGLDYCSPGTYRAPTPDVLYQNDGDGTFADVSLASGVATQLGTGLGIGIADFTGNGYPDIFVANDGMTDRLWVNDGQGRLTDQAMALGCAVDEDGKTKAGMGVTVNDLDDDGDFDVLVCNLRSETDSLHRNVGGSFMDGTAAAGLAVVSRPFTRFGLGFVDFDLDGYLDLYEANGRVLRYADVHGDDPFAEPNVVYRGSEQGRFTEVTPRGGTPTPLIATSRAAAFGDVDDDGDVDVLVVNRDTPAYLLRNTADSSGSWIMFRVRERSGADALGATVTMSVAGRRITRPVQSAWSYLAANDPRVHVGLDDADGVQSVTVRWADGVVDEFGDFPAGSVHELRRP